MVGPLRTGLVILLIGLAFGGLLWLGVPWLVLGLILVVFGLIGSLS